VAVFEMTDGVVFTYRGSWCAEGMNTSWECEWRAVCSKGSARWDGFKSITAETVVGSDGFTRKTAPVEVPEAQPLELTGHKALIREFIDCIKTGKVPQTVCTDNIKSLAMVHAAIESASTRKRVEIKI
jgi:predicted dehydrogenase